MKRRIVREIQAEAVYEYIPLGKYVVSAPAVCRGRPTFKHTRIEVAGVLERLGAGDAIGDLVDAYQGRVPREAIEEATLLAAKALVQRFPARSGSGVGGPTRRDEGARLSKRAASAFFP
jgi:uncharacterized protein (DUF433 family)